MIIYILKLENDKYYIGKTHDIIKRLHFHKNNLGSEWTKKYKYKSVIKTINSNSPFDEDKYVKIYMDKYGIDNVRGGSYNQIILSSEQKNNLIKELQTINNACYRCGRNNHFIKNSKKIYNIRANPDIDEYIYKNKNNQLMMCVYKDSPNTLFDVTFYPENNPNNEHPFEYMAYTLESEISKLF